MKILSAVIRNYCGQPDSVDMLYLAFTLPLHQLGHEVDHFDHVTMSQQIGPEPCGEAFLQMVRHGGYDLVLYQTGGSEFISRDILCEAMRHAPTVAWNSDDDWQWDIYSRHLAPCFTFMVTTYPHIYEMNRGQYPNLRLSQWGALDLFADFGRKKDLDFTFAGQIYRNRIPEMRKLWWKSGLRVYGLGSLRVWCPPLNNRRFRETAAKVIPALNRAIDFRSLHDIWNRSKISYTPMAASVSPRLLQIKSRAFEMGLSGTLMLCQRNPNLGRYYEPGKEFVPYQDTPDCMEKVRYYLTHESERQKIVTAYYRRTRAEHMWEHRWKQLFKDIGFATPQRSNVA